MALTVAKIQAALQTLEANTDPKYHRLAIDRALVTPRKYQDRSKYTPAECRAEGNR